MITEDDHDGLGRPRGGHLHVLLHGPGPPRGRHGGHADRRVAARARLRRQTRAPADESATQHGFSLPSTSSVKRVTSWNQPPSSSSTETTSARRADPRSGRHRRREADLVPAVVDAELDAGDREHLLAEAVDQRERQVAVGDRDAEGALGLRPLDVDVDPLVVAGELGEQVDVLLGDLAPLARADLLCRSAPSRRRCRRPRPVPRRRSLATTCAGRTHRNGQMG